MKKFKNVYSNNNKNVKLGKDDLNEINCLTCMCTKIRSILKKNKRYEVKSARKLD